MANADINIPHDENGLIATSFSDSPIQEVLWDRAALIVITLLFILGFALPVLAQLP